MQVLEAQKQSIVLPSDRSNLHPLVIPLAVQLDNGQSETVYTCLLRQVTLSNSNDQVCDACYSSYAQDLQVTADS